MTRNYALMAVFALGFACDTDDEREECATLPPFEPIAVDMTSGTPVFSWNSEAGVENLYVSCGTGTITWDVLCGGPHSVVDGCITSPVVYGEDPEGAYYDDPDYYVAPHELPSGTCTVTLTTRCSTEGADDSISASAEFTVP
jgi:hypothetical protein